MPRIRDWNAPHAGIKTGDWVVEHHNGSVSAPMKVIVLFTDEDNSGMARPRDGGPEVLINPRRCVLVDEPTPHRTGDTLATWKGHTTGVQVHGSISGRWSVPGPSFAQRSKTETPPDTGSPTFRVASKMALRNMIEATKMPPEDIEEVLRSLGFMARVMR